ncbi:MAG: hypothetical protein JO235_15635 [Chroococcidiopsidaceae cyanobacterium CP_BM_RX_35]|nr:hypothetical protein [Chroococcidiopsidaceae cyanobacterium CP_BM_RX_35]
MSAPKQLLVQQRHDRRIAAVEHTTDLWLRLAQHANPDCSGSAIGFALPDKQDCRLEPFHKWQ